MVLYFWGRYELKYLFKIKKKISFIFQDLATISLIFPYFFIVDHYWPQNYLALKQNLIVIFF